MEQAPQDVVVEIFVGQEAQHGALGPFLPARDESLANTALREGRLDFAPQLLRQTMLFR